MSDGFKFQRVIVKVYMTKNVFCLFERTFKIQKNGVFLKHLLVLETLTFFYYAN